MAYRYLTRAAIVASLTWAGSAQAAVTLYGLVRADSGRTLVSFNSETPGVFNTSNVITFQNAPATTDLFSLDLNTSNNTLYTIGSIGGGDYALFSLSYTGVATQIGSGLGVNLGTENLGLDYDSMANVFRVVTNDDKTFSINPLTGLASSPQKIDYAPNDPLGGRNPNVVAAGYRGQLYVLDKNGPGVGTSLLSTLSGTTLTSRAVINETLDTNASFDIASNGEAYFDNGKPTDNLFLLNLTTGAIVDKGKIQRQLTGLTAGGPTVTTPAVPEPASWITMILGVGVVGGALRGRRRSWVTYA